MKIFKSIILIISIFISLGFRNLEQQKSNLDVQTIDFIFNETTISGYNGYTSYILTIQNLPENINYLGMTGTISLTTDESYYESSSLVLFHLGYFESGECPNSGIKTENLGTLEPDRLGNPLFKLVQPLIVQINEPGTNTYVVDLDLSIPSKLNIGGCMTLAYGGGDYLYGQPILMSGELSISYSVEENNSKTSFFELGSEFCNGIGCFNSISEYTNNPYAVYNILSGSGAIRSITGNIDHGSLQLSPYGIFPPSGVWGSETKFYFVPSCQPPPNSHIIPRLGENHKIYNANINNVPPSNAQLLFTDTFSGNGISSQQNEIDIYLNIPYNNGDCILEITRFSGALGGRRVETQITSQLETPVFEDVNLAHYNYNNIMLFYNSGITVGCSQTPKMFCPENIVTRGELSVFLLRAIHGSSYQPNPLQTNIFVDVPYEVPAFTKWIEQFYLEGMTSGCSQYPKMFCPKSSITKGEIAVFILRAVHGSSYSPPPATGTLYNDVSISTTFSSWIEQASREGFIISCGSGNYCPNSIMTRSNIASVIARAFLQ